MKSLIWALFLAFPAMSLAQTVTVGPPLPPPPGGSVGGGSPAIPYPDATLLQKDSQGNSIPMGGVYSEETIFFECMAPVNNVKLNIEIKHTSEYFDGTVTISSSSTGVNQMAFLSYEIPDIHPYKAHWQAWWEDATTGQVSPKVSFGNNQEIDADFHKGSIGEDGEIYREPFLFEGYPPDWIFANTSGSVQWYVDGSPSDAPGGAYHTTPFSMNYNNGTHFYDGLPTWGFAATPILNLGLVQNPVLKFWCNYETETSGSLKDHRYVSVHNDYVTIVYYDAQLYTDQGSCDGMGIWHQHSIPLESSWGEVRIRFTFDSIDKFNNMYAGWFIDDIEINGTTPPGLDSASLDQLDEQGSPIPVGSVVEGDSITFVGSVEVFNGYPVRLEIEFQRLGIAFTGEPSHVGGFFTGTAPLSVTLSDFSGGDYRWQARLADTEGTVSDWIEFGLNPTTDRDFHWLSIEEAPPEEVEEENPVPACSGSLSSRPVSLNIFILFWGFLLLLSVRNPQP